GGAGARAHPRHAVGDGPLDARQGAEGLRGGGRGLRRALRRLPCAARAAGHDLQQARLGRALRGLPRRARGPPACGARPGGAWPERAGGGPARVRGGPFGVRGAARRRAGRDGLMRLKTLLLVAVVAVAGFTVATMLVYRGRPTPGAVFLTLGWMSILATGFFL